MNVIDLDSTMKHVTLVVVALYNLSFQVSAQSPAVIQSSHYAPEHRLAAEASTIPFNDEVLEVAPEALSIEFPVAVRLVKFTLRKDNREWVDINFRYMPAAEVRYSLPIPDLSNAKYYIAEWAVLGNDDQLIRGSFSFAFGPEAQAPSYHRAAEELILRQRYGDPTIRYVAPPRTQIIIDQEPRRFDPPFTINLEVERSGSNLLN
ncbi:MAG TPA: hypothetical protein DEF79_05685 [Gammaproteobacteria bacterium]|nr:hypothetical protein [Gammaproteobacteria bacterium]